ncbi:alpha/beta hydrolase [Bowmanella dokdonensis]|uniref:Alpha/beta hydrolase n=1 Tax=Bowmanella dokdonensis TaxID=751969 RepID=A0A939IT63_9ALTE|nr:alpha/beta hydrolase-fold protein [Bowmanella dokdonensis]MBN7827146.1 alpha/beta hydrolase [Bowmanella dokdonensis]
MMLNARYLPLLVIVTFGCCVLPSSAQVARGELPVEPLNVGQSFILQSQVLSEPRRINLYFPQAYLEQTEQAFPVLYMPDGGLKEDFLHIAGLVQIGSLNWTTRPFILVGIENTDRKRDLTGPTTNEEDKKISPLVGKSADFRKFIRNELMPAVNSHYRTSGESAIVGESLAGLFVVETLLQEPDLFNTYIAVDPSLWWNTGHLVEKAPELIKQNLTQPIRVHLAASRQPGIVEPTRDLAATLKQAPGIDASFTEFPDETHLSVYHPAALEAFRRVFARE